MGMSAARCQGNVREFQSVWRVVTLIIYHIITYLVVSYQVCSVCDTVLCRQCCELIELVLQTCPRFQC